MSTRTRFHSSQLIRCLADLDMVEAADSGSAFAEKLGGWIHFADAIALSAVHNDSDTIPSPLPCDARIGAQADSEFGRVRAELAQSLLRSFSSRPGKAHNSLPAPGFDFPIDPAAAYVPYRRFYEAHQRDMESRIRPLRHQVREALAQASPRLGKLAELDTLLEKIMRDRESRLLARLPVLLRKRFERLFREQGQCHADMQAGVVPADWSRPGGWLARFCRDMQTLLEAELEFRLQPTLGLIEALKQDTQ